MPRTRGSRSSGNARLVSISRSAFYYQPAGETPLNLELMRLLDAQFLETPWYGSH